MRLTKLHIKNFRGIEELEVNLIDRFTVIVGENGAGKTSILDAVASAIRLIIPWDSSSAQRSKDINENVLKVHPDFANQLIWLERSDEIRKKVYEDYLEYIFPLSVRAEAELQKGKQVTWERMITDSEEAMNKISENAHISLLDIQTNSSELHTKGNYRFFHPKDKILPIFAYYGTGRLWASRADAELRQKRFRIDGYDNALNPNFSNRSFLSWYKTYEYEVKQRNKDDRLLQALKNAITTCIDGWFDIFFSPYENDLMGLFTPENGEPYWIPFGMLSDGYRNLIGMVADIAYRCITLNPQLKENAVTEAEGIILIDEVGLHLHPKWQRKVVDDLKRAFPKIQFIATTHSPFVVQSLKSSELFNLDRISDVNPSDLTVEEVAFNLMGVPSKFSEENARQEELSKEYLMRINKLHQEKASAEEISKELDKIETEISDPAVRAFLQMKRLQQSE